MHASETPSKTMARTVIDGWKNSPTIVQESCANEVRWLQWAIYMIFDLQYAKLLPEITFGATTFFLSDLIEELARKLPFLPEVSTIQRIKAFAVDLAYHEIAMQLCTKHISGDKYCEITAYDFLMLKPRMYITIENMANAFMMMLPVILPPMKFAIMTCIDNYIIKKISNGDDFDSLFFHTFHNNIRTPDYNWLYLDMDALIHFIAAEVPALLRGFTPNDTMIESHLLELAKLPMEQLSTYFPLWDLKGKLGKLPGKKLAQPFSVHTTGTFTKTHRLKIASHRLDSVLHFDTGKAFDGVGQGIDTAIGLHLDIIKDDVVHTSLRCVNNCKGAPCDACFKAKAKSAATVLTREIVKQLRNYKDNSAGSLSELRSSFFWEPKISLVSITWEKAMSRIMKRKYREDLEDRINQHFEKKFVSYYKIHYGIEGGVWKKKPSNQIPLHESTMCWFVTLDSVAAIPRTTIQDSFETAAKAMQKCLAKKNQFERVIYGGPGKEKHEMRTFVIGDIPFDNSPVYDPEKAYIAKPKNRNLPNLGVDLLAELEHNSMISDIDVTIPYDLDVYSAEECLAANGFSLDEDFTFTSEIHEAMNSTLLSSDANLDGLFLHGVEAKELAPLGIDEIHTSTDRMKQVIMNANTDHENDFFFPAHQLLDNLNMALSSQIDPRYFNLVNFEDDPKRLKALCWLPVFTCQDC
jgi:hypothetical protein